MTKITREDIIKIRELRQNMTQKQVSLLLHISEVTIRKYESYENCLKAKQKAILKYEALCNNPIKLEAHKIYMRNYMKTRYQNDAEFRKKMIDYALKSQKKIRELHKLNNINEV